MEEIIQPQLTVSSWHSDPGPASQLLSLDGTLDLRQRGCLIDLDRQLHGHWGLGKNFVLAWSPVGREMLLLVVPHYRIADYAIATRSEFPDDEGTTFITRLLSGSRRFTERQIVNAGRLLDVDPVRVLLRQPLLDTPAETALIDRLVRRYSVSYSAGRAVALFDIVGFGLLSPFEQMTQLNSLSHSLNSAHSRMLDSAMPIDFARSSTGDGFYIWNRETGPGANTHLYHFMNLVLADNAIARSKAQGRTVPALRAAFHVGSCYEFFHAEGLNPTLYTDLVGEVTIDLARMVERAMPGQVMVGEFEASLTAAPSLPPLGSPLDSIDFVAQAQHSLAQLNGLVLSGDAIESIKCYLTGEARRDGTFTIRRLAVKDKHGLTRFAYNAKINIYRRAAEPILLGIEDRLLRGSELGAQTAGQMVRDGHGSP
jgi:hypothetical protein